MMRRQWMAMTVSTLALALLCATASSAQSLTQPNQVAPTRPATASNAGGPNEGIKVHGHWTIDVLNRDGSLAAHYEFENALANHLGASTFLNGVLARTKRVGKWAVALPDQAGQPLIWIVESGYSGFGPGTPVLTVTTPTSGPNTGKLVLSGSGPAPRSAQINFVQTEVEMCPAPGDPAPCGSGFGFSQKSLTTAISVAEGQIVQLSVVFSFS